MLTIGTGHRHRVAGDGLRTLPAQLGISLRVVRAIPRNPALRRVQLACVLFNTVEFGTWVAILLYAYGHPASREVAHHVVAARPA